MSSTPKHILDRIQIAKEQQLKELDLSWSSIIYQLTEFPPEIFNLENLEILNLRDNDIKFIPESIAKLANLRQLYLQNTQLTSLPESLENLTELTVLYIEDNQLTSLPESVGNLTNLTSLAREQKSINKSSRIY